MKMNSYMSSYLDRRMGDIIDDWQLSTRGELRDLVSRFKAVQAEVDELKAFEMKTNRRLSDMEDRVRRLQEKTI